MGELHNCPNCGARPKLRKKRGKVRFECDGDCWTTTRWHWDNADAIKEWNSLRKEVLSDDND